MRVEEVSGEEVLLDGRFTHQGVHALCREESRMAEIISKMEQPEAMIASGCRTIRHMLSLRPGGYL